MKESYLACFPGGTSGRFILHLMWRSITGQDYSIQFDEANSSHPESPWWSPYFEFPTIGPKSNMHRSQFFQALKLNEEEIGKYQMGFCHVFPDFDQLRIKAPDTKLVLVSYHYDNIVEIVTNNTRKNSAQLYVGNLVKDLINDPLFKSLHYDDLKDYYNVYNIQSERLTDDFFNLVIDKRIKYIRQFFNEDPFSDDNLTVDNVPEDFRSKTLIIKYSDIYNKDGNEYIAIQKIENFLQKKIGPVTRQSYETYVANRIS